jgi:signal transduction histidine kinase
VDKYAASDTNSHEPVGAPEFSGSAASWSKGLSADTLGNLAHELRTPIQVITGLIEILRDEHLDQLSEQSRAIIERLNVNICDLAQTLDNLMAYALLQAGRTSAFDEEMTINSILAEISSSVEAANSAKGLDLRFDLNEAPPVICAPRRIAKSIILNLILNAIKFTEAGTVSVAVRETSAQGRAAQIEIVVSDTGTGLDPALLDQLSQPFQQLSRSSARHYRGLGLGLAIVRHNVALLGGELELRSHVGKGATFIVRFPVRRKNSPRRTGTGRMFRRAVSSVPVRLNQPFRANILR